MSWIRAGTARARHAAGALLHGDVGPRARLVGRLVLVAVLLVAAARLVGPETARLSAGTLEVRVRPAIPGGQLTMGLGPFGTLSWDLYTAPLDVDAAFLIDPRASALPSAEEFEGIAGDFARAKIPWLLAFGVALGLLAHHGHGRRRRALAVGVTATAFLVATLGAGVSAIATVNQRALVEPRYEGPIGDAPRVLQIIREIGRDFEGVQENLARVVAGLQRIHADIVTQRPAPLPEDTVRLLVIADVHNNPLGLLIARELVRDFDVHGILNAGDFTDRGTAPEGELFAGFGSFDLPQLVVPGNHEDRAAIARVARVPGAVVVDQEAQRVTFLGLDVLSAPDPNAGSIGDDPFNEAAEEGVPRICEAMRASAAEDAPDVVVVHDPRLGECAAAQAETAGAPLVFVWGHTHRPAFEHRGSVIGVGPGTSGAGGPKSSKEAPYGFAIVELDRATGRAASVCQFLFDGPQRARQVACHFLSPDPDATPG